MRGGYLTLDFSDVNVKEDESLIGLKLGNRKGIYNYLKNNTKPIQIIFSKSMCKNFYKYYTGQSYTSTTNIMYRNFNAIPIISMESSYVGDNRLCFLIITTVETIGESSFDNYRPTSLYIQIDENDDLIFWES